MITCPKGGPLHICNRLDIASCERAGRGQLDLSDMCVQVQEADGRNDLEWSGCVLVFVKIIDSIIYVS